MNIEMITAETRLRLVTITILFLILVCVLSRIFKSLNSRSLNVIERNNPLLRRFRTNITVPSKIAMKNNIGSITMIPQINVPV